MLLHGYPSSSFMFRQLIPALEEQFHLIAPDYPGFGNSEAPPPSQFAYTFEHLAAIMGADLDGPHVAILIGLGSRKARNTERDPRGGDLAERGRSAVRLGQAYPLRTNPIMLLIEADHAQAVTFG